MNSRAVRPFPASALVSLCWVVGIAALVLNAFLPGEHGTSSSGCGLFTARRYSGRCFRSPSGLRPWDPSGVLVGITAAVACYVPARRGASGDLNTALRQT